MSEVIETIKNLGTTRRADFSQKIIPASHIDEIKQSITATANASNRQSYSVIILDEDKAARLSLPGDRVFIFCIDFNRLHKCADRLNCHFDSTYFMQYSTALIDISLLAQSAVIAAKSLGIDSLITNEIYHKHIDLAFKELKLPEKGVFPMIALCLGYSKVTKHKKGRINNKFVFFENEYSDYSANEIKDIIDDADDAENHIGLISNWRERGYDHYYEWFFKKWSTQIGTQQESEKLVRSLEEHNII